MYPLDSLNSAKSHAVGIHLQALSFDFMAVAFLLVTVEELTVAIDTNMILFAVLLAIFLDMG